MPLERIKIIMGRQDFDVLGALEDHKQELRQRVQHLERLIVRLAAPKPRKKPNRVSLPERSG
jgi:hypothetical protein